MKAAHSAHEIAQYLLWRVAQERPEDPDYLTPLKLQKLLYYVQGWHVLELDQPAFSESIRAWRDGPVVQSVYKEFEDCGKRPITDAPAEPPQLAPVTRAVVEGVWNRYKGFSAFKLSDMTHGETPWKNARANLPASASSDRPISLEDLRREFEAQVQASQRRLRAHAKQIRAAAREHTRRVAPDLYARDQRSS